MKLKPIMIIISIILAFSQISCSVYQTVANLTRLKFKLQSVNNFSIAGISFSNKSRISDFNALEIVKLTAAFTHRNIPATFRLNIDALNPNDGTGGYPRTNATLKDFPWRLLVQEKETISGGLGYAVTVPGTGENVTIPLDISIDLYKFFNDKGYEDLINLALAIGGSGGNASNLSLYARPTVTSPVGDLTYPQEIKIVSYEYSR